MASIQCQCIILVEFKLGLELEFGLPGVMSFVFGKHACHKLYTLSTIRLNQALANSIITITQPLILSAI